MKKIISICFAWILLASSAFAAGGEPKSWYFSNKGNNCRSQLPGVDPVLAAGIGKDEKTLYLTFDAGYENGNVKRITDILRDNEVNGAFFVLEHFITANPELTREIKENGNLVCNHTCRHMDISKADSETIGNDLKKLEQIYTEATGYEMDRFFRPPEGKYSDAALESVKEAGYQTVFWSLAYADWDNNHQMSGAAALEKLTGRIHNGAVILLHPTSQTNAEILDEFIKQMKNEGYRFGSLEELWN